MFKESAILSTITVLEIIGPGEHYRKGIPITLELTFASITLVVVSGFVLGLGRSSKARAIKWPCGFVVEVLRGSSAIAQLFWAF
jgi:His/Glu/Gln/Arg/opine family amino acid ABC transporter permease subunit